MFKPYCQDKIINLVPCPWSTSPQCDQGLFVKKSVIDYLRQSLVMKDQVQWQSDCSALPKLRTFLLFKNFNCDSPHIYKPLSFIQKKTIAKLRLGMLQLRIETGRFSRPRLEPEERVCLVCNSGAVENESHFLLHCNTYLENRQKLYGFIPDIANFNLLSDIDRLKFLLNDPVIIKQTSKFIVESYEHRSTIV